jgi:hypothetical protein
MLQSTRPSYKDRKDEVVNAFLHRHLVFKGGTTALSCHIIPTSERPDFAGPKQVDKASLGTTFHGVMILKMVNGEHMRVRTGLTNDKFVINDATIVPTSEQSDTSNFTGSRQVDETSLGATLH